MSEAPKVGALRGLPEGGGDRQIRVSQRPKEPRELKEPRKNDAERRQQFEDLALPLLQKVYAMALHLVRDPNKAEDMVQETYLRAWQNFDRFEIGTHFKAWIFQILTYLFLNDRRSGYRREATVDFSEHDLLKAPDIESFDGVNSWHDWDSLYPNLVEDALKRALDRLGSEQRAVFLLVTLGELSYQECAAALKLPIGTVMSRLFRARKQLQDELKDYAQTKGLLKGAPDQHAS